MNAMYFSIMLGELDAHKDAWPFKLPVDTKACPLYRKVIQRPIDLSTVQKNLHTHKLVMIYELIV